MLKNSEYNETEEIASVIPPQDTVNTNMSPAASITYEY